MFVNSIWENDCACFGDEPVRLLAWHRDFCQAEIPSPELRNGDDTVFHYFCDQLWLGKNLYND